MFPIATPVFREIFGRGAPVRAGRKTPRQGRIASAFLAMVLGALLVIPAARAAAEERHEQFLRALLDKGYDDLARFYLETLDARGKLPTDLGLARALQDGGHGDLALAFLERLEARPDLPAEVRDLLDYELGKTLSRLSETADSKNRRRHTERAIEYLRNYLKKHTETHEVFDARNELAAIMRQRGQRLLASLDAEQSDDARAQLRTDARAALAESRAELATLLEAYRNAIAEEQDSLQERPRQRSRSRRNPRVARLSGRDSKSTAQADRKARLEGAMVSAELNLARVEYHLAQTCDRESTERQQTLEAAAGRFDAIYQRYRNQGGTFAGIYAHLWQGKVFESLGELETALDVFDEVIAFDGATAGEIQDIVNLAFLSRCQAMNEAGRHEEVLSDPVLSAELWLQEHASDRRSPHGLGIQLELAKAWVGTALDMPEGSSARRRQFMRAMRVLNEEVTQYPSPHREEGFRLRDRYAREVRDHGGKLASFAEAMFVADASLRSENWSEAVDAYLAALNLTDRMTDASELNAAQYRLAYAYYKLGRYDEAAETGEKLARADPRAKEAAESAGIAMLARYAAVLAARDDEERKRAANRLLELSSYVEETWPAARQADDARALRGNALLLRRKYAAAAQAFEETRPDSQNYAESQMRAGRAYWSAYAAEAAKAESQRDAQAMTRWLEKARELLERGIDAERAATAEGQPVSAALVEGQVVRAEIALRTEGAAQAEPWIEPLLPLVQEERRKDLDDLSGRVLVAALEIAVAGGQLDRANQLVDRAIDRLGDSSRLTALLVQLTRGMRERLDQQESAAQAGAAAETRKALAGILDRLSASPRQDFASLGHVAESYFALGSYEQAAGLYARMLDRVETLPDSVTAQQRRGEVIRVTLRLATALRMQGQYEESLERIERLLLDHEAQQNDAGRRTYPLAIEMEKGHTLQAWSKSDRSQLEAAARQWNAVAQRLSANSPKPIEYFEARLGLAKCLLERNRRDDSVRVLRSTMSLNPDCGTAEMKAEFEALLKRAGSRNSVSRTSREHRL